MSLAPWHAEPWQSLLARLRTGSVPHALLLAGPSGLGKREFADALARSLLCTSRADDGSACGACKSCVLVSAGSHPDLIHISILEDKTQISVDQIRALSERLALSTQYGGWRVALISPADEMNLNASNALLKTLEEPSTGSVIVLLSDQPSRLPATIRSRCQRVDFRLPARTDALAWLRDQGVTDPAAALDLSDGNPGRALEWSRANGLELRADCANDLRALSQGRGNLLEIANRWTKNEPERRLWFAATLAREQLRAALISESGPFTLTAGADLTKLAEWFDQANRSRDWLRGPVRSELMMLELLISWRALAPAP
jgi:DNA polymerase III subunit delta'